MYWDTNLTGRQVNNFNLKKMFWAFAVLQCHMTWRFGSRRAAAHSKGTCCRWRQTKHLQGKPVVEHAKHEAHCHWLQHSRLGPVTTAATGSPKYSRVSKHFRPQHTLFRQTPNVLGHPTHWPTNNQSQIPAADKPNKQPQTSRPWWVQLRA